MGLSPSFLLEVASTVDFVLKFSVSIDRIHQGLLFPKKVLIKSQRGRNGVIIEEVEDLLLKFPGQGPVCRLWLQLRMGNRFSSSRLIAMSISLISFMRIGS